MESNNINMELIQIAIQRLIDDQKEKKQKKIIPSFTLTKSNHDVHDNDDDDDDDQILLSKLLSQLESLKEHERRQVEDKEIEVNSSVEVAEDDNIKNDEDTVSVLVEVKEEIRKLKKQNTITHCLLSFMILLTLAWQYSEVTFIWKVKSTFTNPFKSFGDMFNGMFKSPPTLLLHQDDANHRTSSSESDNHVKTDAPLLPQLDLSSLGLDNED